MLALAFALYVQHAQASCCIEAPSLPRFAGMVCRYKEDIDAIIDLYAEHKPGDEKLVQLMVSKTHQCARLVWPKPIYVVYRGKRAMGPNGLAEVIGLAFRPGEHALIYGIVRGQGIDI